MGALWIILADLAGVVLVLVGIALAVGSILPVYGRSSSSSDGAFGIAGIVLFVAGIAVLVVAGAVL